MIPPKGGPARVAFFVPFFIRETPIHPKNPPITPPKTHFHPYGVMTFLYLYGKMVSVKGCLPRVCPKEVT